MNGHELVLQPHPEHGAGSYQLLLDGHDLSMITQADGVSLRWDDGRPVVTITVTPDRVHLDGVAAEVVEALMTTAEAASNNTDADSRPLGEPS